MEAVTFGGTAMSGTHASLQKCQIFGKQPGASLQELKLVGLSQMQKNGCGRMATPAKIKLLFPLKVEANVSGIGKKVNGTKVNGTKVEMGGKKNKSSLEEEEETTTTATAAGGQPKSSFSSTMPAGLKAYAQSPALQAVLAALANVVLAAEKQRKLEEIAGKTEVPVDALRQGRLVEGKLVYRQTFVIRSYEVGADKTASVETLMNHFQETALNHVWMVGLAGDGFGATHAMIRHNLIWVVSRMQVQVEQYPAWGDVVEMDTWVTGSGKNGMRRDWLVRDYKTGQVLARATSTWVMMNQKTRRLSKMPNEVREEISSHFLERSAIKEHNLVTQKIKKLDDSAQLVRSGLTPKRSDLDMNQHVNNVKYIGWMMESIPSAIQEGHELETLILEYRRECSQSDVVQSMTSTESSTAQAHNIEAEVEMNGTAAVNGEERTAPFPSGTAPFPSGATLSSALQEISNASRIGPLQFTHLLRLQVDGAEIVRGSTHWRLKKPFHHNAH